MRKSLLAAAALSAFIAQAEIVEPLFIENELGVDATLDYKLLKEMGPWDDRNYQLTKKDIALLPQDDQILANVPLFFKIQYRKQHPETGKYYPRSLYQNFLGNYGGLLVDGVWYKEGLGNGTFTEDSYGKTTAANQLRVAANEVALENGVLGDESAIECNPTNKNNCVAGTNSQNGQTMYYSSDGGVSWTKSQSNPGSSCCDPTVDWSSDGSIVYQGDLSRVGSSIGVRWSRSLDQGQTWESMKSITTTGSDKEYLHVDRSPSSPYLDNLYMTWHDGNVLQFARSTDKGLSFQTPISFSSEPRGIGSDATTDSAGNLYYFYPSTTSSSGIRMLKSTNGGASFAASTRVAVLNGSFEIKIPSMETRNAFIYTSADVDRSNDTIYVAWTDKANDSSSGNTSATANHAWIQVAKSTNGGASWTSCAVPHDTSDSIAAGNAQDRYHPWIKVGDDSTVHIGYYDTRHSTNRTGVDFYYSTSTDACASWTETRFTSQTSSNLSDGQEWGDYNGLSVVLDKIAMTWTDNRSGKATFVGIDTITGGGGGGNASPTASFTQNCNNLSCSFDGSASSDSDGSIAAYSWSIGGTAVTASKTYASYGSYSVTLTVTDDLGATGSSTQTVTLVDPNASILSNGVAKTGLSGATNNEQNWTMSVPAGATNLSFDMSGGTGDADIYVRFGSAPTTSTYDCRPYATGNNESCPVTNAQTGTYYVMIRAYAAYSGVSLTGSFNAPAANVAPTASFTSNCTDLSCSFDGSGSSDSDGTISSYSWSFGATGSTASNTYGSAGTYAVTLTVTDNDGATASSTQNVTVTAPPANIAPTASFTSNCTDLSCSFDGSASSDSDGTIASYSWSFGASGVTATNTYASAGTYTVTLTVTDNDGATNAASQSVTVTAPPVNVAPTASFTSNCTDLTCSFDGSASSDSDGTIASYSWSFGSTGASASNTYASAGTYAVTLTVTDNNGATGTSTQNVTVTAPPAGNVLSNGVTVTGLSAATGATVDYTMVVPAGATGLSFAISGGTGDADIYVRFGAAPTTSNYDCRPYATGNNETCNETAQAGTYYIMVRAYAAFSGVSLTGSYSTGGSTGQVFSSTTNVNIPDNNATGATSNIVSDRAGASNSMKITYNIIHTYIGDLKVELIDPNGTVTTLRNNTGGSANDINESKTINKGSTTATGTWGLRVIDSAGADTGYINSWSIEFL